MVARFQSGDAGAHLFHDTGTFVAQDGGEDPFGVGPGEGEGIGVADAGGDDAYQYFARFRALHVHFFNGERFACLPGYGGA